MEAIDNSNHIQTNPIKATINGSIGKSVTPKKMSNEDQFNAAVNVIRRLPKNGPFQPSDDMKLKFYAYYKQATEGPNDTRKPAFYDIVNRYKWDAWKKLGAMDRQTAMQSYIDELKKVCGQLVGTPSLMTAFHDQVIETMSFNESVSEFYEVLGPFHEFLPQEVVKETNGTTNGSLANDITENLIETKSEIQMMKVGKKWSKSSFKELDRTEKQCQGSPNRAIACHCTANRINQFP